jgi:hypothetical protein
MDEITKLDFTPELKELLREYCYAIYEENACTDEYHLLAEYNLLKRDNKLHLLFELSHFNNRMTNEYNTRRYLG